MAPQGKFSCQLGLGGFYEYGPWSHADLEQNSVLKGFLDSQSGNLTLVFINQHNKEDFLNKMYTFIVDAHVITCT
jgi:hypothetical protein